VTVPRRAAMPRRSKALGPGAPPSIQPAEPPSPAPSPAAEPASSVFDGQYRVKLDAFEGPLDLLLHLIQEHELDILDIPVSFITEKYLEYLKLMQNLSIEIASEYLVMAATLVHIKSKMLLPVAPAGQDEGLPQEEEEDPRAELIRRLLEYQKYKAAAAELAERGTLGRDVFPRGVEEEAPAGPAPLAKVEVFGLLEAFEKVLKRAKVKIDHEVVFDRISITERIIELTEKLQGRRAVRFEWLFLSASRAGPPSRFDLVITFLAMLEMCRMRLLRVYQTGPLAPIYLGLVEETADLSDEDRACADRDADATMADFDPPANETTADLPASEDPVNEIALGPSPEDEGIELGGVPADRGDETVTEHEAPESDFDRQTMPTPPPAEEGDRETIPGPPPPEEMVSPGEEAAALEPPTPTDPDNTEDLPGEVTDDG
jgi:segregation and condensation protein A